MTMRRKSVFICVHLWILGLRNGSLISQAIPLGIADSGIFVVVVVVVIDLIVAPRILSHPKNFSFSEYDYDNDYV